MRHFLTLMFMAILAFGGDYDTEIKKLDIQIKEVRFLSDAYDTSLEASTFCFKKLTESKEKECQNFAVNKREYIQKEFKSSFGKSYDIEKFIDWYDNLVARLIYAFGDCIKDGSDIEICKFNFRREMQDIVQTATFKIEIDKGFINACREIDKWKWYAKRPREY